MNLHTRFEEKKMYQKCSSCEQTHCMIRISSVLYEKILCKVLIKVAKTLSIAKLSCIILFSSEDTQ